MSTRRITLVDVEMSRNVQLVVNLSANLLAFVVSLGISFFLSPYIVKNLGAEANGFVTLANNFVSYATLVKTALNAVGSRYIIVAYHRGELEKANRYYSSIFWGDLTIAFVGVIAAGLFINNMEKMINVPANILLDVKLLFFFVFLNFIFNTAATVFSSAPFIKNKIYLQSIRDIQCSVIRGVLLIILFTVYSPKVYYLGIATLLSGCVLIGYNYYYKKKLVPNLRIKKTYFDWKCIKELVSQGIWDTFSSLGEMLLTSFDLLIANIVISPFEMGVLSVAKSMPAVISGIGSTLATAFFSEMTICYAKDDVEGLAKVVKQACMIISAIVTIPLAYLVVFGSEFYMLWQPTLDSNTLQIASVLTCAGLMLCAGCNVISTIFTITLHMKESAISVLLSGLISVSFTLIILKYTDLGIFAIAGVSSGVDTVRMLGYIVPTGAKYLKLKPLEFFPTIIRTMVSSASICFVGFILKRFMVVDSWMMFFVSVVTFGVIGIVANYGLSLDRQARTTVNNFICSKLANIIRKG